MPEHARTRESTLERTRGLCPSDIDGQLPSLTSAAAVGPGRGGEVLGSTLSGCSGFQAWQRADGQDSRTVTVPPTDWAGSLVQTTGEEKKPQNHA